MRKGESEREREREKRKNERKREEESPSAEDEFKNPFLFISILLYRGCWTKHINMNFDS